MVAFGDKFFIKKKCSFAAKLKTKISNFFPSCEFGPGSFFFFFLVTTGIQVFVIF